MTKGKSNQRNDTNRNKLEQIPEKRSGSEIQTDKYGNTKGDEKHSSISEQSKFMSVYTFKLSLRSEHRKTTNLSCFYPSTEINA